MKGDILSWFIELKETDTKYLRDVSCRERYKLCYSFLDSLRTLQASIAQEIREAIDVVAGSIIDEHI